MEAAAGVAVSCSLAAGDGEGATSTVMTSCFGVLECMLAASEMVVGGVDSGLDATWESASVGGIEAEKLLSGESAMLTISGQDKAGQKGRAKYTEKNIERSNSQCLLAQA